MRVAKRNAQCWDKELLRMEYCHKRGLAYCIENPTSSLLWNYKPMEAWFVFVCAQLFPVTATHMKAYTYIYIYIYVYVFMCYMLFLGARKHFDVIVQFSSVCL